MRRRHLTATMVLLLLAAGALAGRIALAQTVVPIGPMPLSMGSGPIFSDPSCAANGTGSAWCAAVGPAGTLVVDHFDASGAAPSWSGWTALAGVVTSQPSCTRSLQGPWCAVRDDQDQMVVYAFDGTAWKGPEVVGGALDGPPSCAPLSVVAKSIVVLCAARGAGDTLFSAQFVGRLVSGGHLSGHWTVLPAQAATIYSPVTCAADAGSPADAYCTWIGGSGAAAFRRFSGHTLTWQSEVESEYPAVPAFSCTSFANDIVGLVGEDSGGAFYTFDINSGTHQVLCYGRAVGGLMYFDLNYDYYTPFIDFVESSAGSSCTASACLSDLAPLEAGVGPDSFLGPFQITSFVVSGAGCAAYTPGGAAQAGAHDRDWVACALTGTDQQTTGGNASLSLYEFEPMFQENQALVNNLALPNPYKNSAVQATYTSYNPVAGTFEGNPSCFAIDFATEPKQAMCVARQTNNTTISVTTQ